MPLPSQTKKWTSLETLLQIKKLSSKLLWGIVSSPGFRDVEGIWEYDCCNCISLHIPNVVRGCLMRGKILHKYIHNSWPAFAFPSPNHSWNACALTNCWHWLVLNKGTGTFFGNDVAQGIHCQGCPGDRFVRLNFLQKFYRPISIKFSIYFSLFWENFFIYCIIFINVKPKYES